MLILSVAWFACVMGHLGFCAHGASWATHGGGAPGKGRYVYYKYLLHSHVHSNVLWTSLTESNYKDKIVKKFEIAIAKHCQSVEPFWTWDSEVGLGCPEQSRSIRPPFWATAALKTAKREACNFKIVTVKEYPKSDTLRILQCDFKSHQMGLWLSIKFNKHLLCSARSKNLPGEGWVGEYSLNE